MTALEPGTWTVGPVDVTLDDGTVAQASRPGGVRPGPEADDTVSDRREFTIDVGFDHRSALRKVRWRCSTLGSRAGSPARGWSGDPRTSTGSGPRTPADPTSPSYTVDDPQADRGLTTFGSR